MKSPRSGFTLLELAIVITLLAIVGSKVLMVVNSANKAMRDQPASIMLEDRARSILDRIALSIMGSDRSTLVPTAEGTHNTSVRYRHSLGTQDGEIVWDETEEIGLDSASVTWTKEPETPDARTIVWTHMVSPLLEGEIPNGIDDNDNGLIDEHGLSFVIDRDSVIVRLSLQRPLSDGRLVTETVQTIATCRN